MPSNSKLTKTQARAAARRRTAQAQEEHEKKLRKELDARLERERQQRELNNGDIARYLTAESEVAAAEAELARVRQRSIAEMGGAVAAIAEREGSVSAAAGLLGISSNRAATLRKAATASPADSPGTETTVASPATQSTTTEPHVGEPQSLSA
ncbi:MAG: hypothetical protein INR66_00220 [Gordonia polyisoprenivorans]|nr:hypothetical protein [Gordonia polyisoprenivorans]